ncbi:leucine-rich repeat domain-containing protein [Prevotella pallens]|uniref:leucine-rich repeat domain-containing protein n=1 Tax=Prevotella pallens TaxID=60133 RepID=UPI001CAFFC8D|nr:leucine-rich repeat domain-containing protein [Prevotella pallens]MBF1451286.1 leucine-rich repeat domain-containing protein [Prevotella pallens]
MKSRLYSMLLLLICTITAQAQEYHVETPGTLQEVIGPGAEELTRIRVTGTLNDKDIAFLHYLCWPGVPKPTGMKVEKFLKIMQEKEDDFKTNLRHLDLEDARMVNDALPDYAFSGSYIKDYKLPKTLKKIGKNAFDYNVLLKELIIPESVEEIGRDLLTYSTEIEKVRLPDNLKILNKDLFAECCNLREVNIPSQLREMYGGVFHNCREISPSVAILPETVEILDGAAYYGIRAIEKVVIPKNVRVLRSAFNGMAGLRKATILTDKLTEIGDDAFYWCSALEEVNIPDKITRIGEGAFFWNLRLSKINIPSTVTRIEKHAFDSAPLDSIDIPAGVTFIGRNAFWNNRNLKKVYSRPVMPPITNEWTDVSSYLPFLNSADEAILYVPKGSADAYRASEVFAGFKEIVELEAWQWPTSISTPTMPTDAYKVYGKDGTLHIETIGGAHDPAFVNVYNINGQVVWKGQVSKRMEVPLPQGVYVVKIGKRNYKVSLT